MRVPKAQFRSLDLEVHGVLRDVPLHYVTAIDLPGGGAGRTISDVRSLMAGENVQAANLVVRLLFALRWKLGRLFGWDSDRHARKATSHIHTLNSDIQRRSVVPSGAAQGPFRVLYVLDRESLEEIRNATAHGFLSSVSNVLRRQGHKTWAAYPVAGLEIDLVTASGATSCGIDLVGYPGRFEERIPLERYKMFHRAGLRIIPISHCRWLADKNSCLAAIEGGLFGDAQIP